MTLRKHLSHFAQDETGASTVEWIVLSAGTIAMALFTIAMMQGFSMTTIGLMFS